MARWRRGRAQEGTKFFATVAVVFNDCRGPAYLLTMASVTEPREGVSGWLKGTYTTP